MAQTELGTLLKERRLLAKMSQDEVADQVKGLTRSGLNSIESGATKTVAADLANGLVGALPVSMPEIVRAMGYNLPTRVAESKLKAEVLALIEKVSGAELVGVRALLRGYLEERPEELLELKR